MQASSSLDAASYTWKGGAGTWNTIDLSWEGSTTAWPATGNENSEAVFQNTGGTVTLDEAVSVNGLVFSGNGYTLSGSGRISLTGDSPYILVNQGITTTISATLEGSNGFTKTGTGTLIYNANNAAGGDSSLTGNITVSEGRLNWAAKNSYFGVTNVITIEDGATFCVTTADAWSFDAPQIVVKAGATLTNQGSVFNLLSGGGLVLSGGTLSSAGQHASYGAWALGEKVIVNGDVTSTITDTVRIGNSKVFYTEFAVENGAANIDLNVTAKISDARINKNTVSKSKLIKSGDGTMRLTNSNDYSGGTTVKEGLVIVGDGGNNGTLGNGGIVIEEKGKLSIDRANSYTISQAISGKGVFEQAGTGTTILGTASAAFEGTFLITQGTLQINATNALGNGLVIINGGTLSQNVDTINLKSVSLTQGTLGAVNALPHTMSLTSDFSMSGGTLQINILSQTSFDQILSTAGTLSLTGGTLNLNGFEGFEGQDETGFSYQLFDGFNAAQIGNLTITGYDTENWHARIDDKGLLTFSTGAIPEPSSMALLVLGAGGLFLRRRK